LTGRHPFADRVSTSLHGRARVRFEQPALKPASVLLALFAESAADAPSVWLLRRADELRTHSGEVALPGGRPEAADGDLLDTALRETEEEIGLDARNVQILGVLDDHVTVTGFVITPYVGWVTAPFEPTPRAREVARVFAAPLSIFEAPPEPLSVVWGADERVVLSFRVDSEVVWGATAAILRGFVTLLGRAP
jgi:8-oxo-dGTP pyrophosphatase MutT (NUDIX family)